MRVWFLVSRVSDTAYASSCRPMSYMRLGEIGPSLLWKDRSAVGDAMWT